MPKFGYFRPKKWHLYNLSEILHERYFEGADFKSDIASRTFLDQIPKFGHLGSKSINILILMKFLMYPILKALISNLTFAFENIEPKSQIWAFWAKKY